MNWTTYNSAGAALSQSLTDMPVGTITGYAGATAPSGWLLCDGSAVSRTTYAELFGVVSTTYGSGNGSTTFNVPDSSGFIILATSQAARLAAAALPQYVTSLPSSPVDGQTVVYAADAANGVMWTLRYRAASSSSYKWEYVGGGPLSASVTTAQSTTSGTYTDLSTSGPSITLPVAGDYVISILAQAASNTNDCGGNASVSVSGGAASSATDADGVLFLTPSANIYQTASTSVIKTGITAAAVTMRYRMTVGGTVTFQNRRITATPVRVG